MIRRIALMSDYYYSDSQPELIHCKFCGEDYAATYKYCPFCETAPNGKKMGHSSRSRQKKGRGGSRARTNTRGGGYGGERTALSIVAMIGGILMAIAAVVLAVFLIRHALSDALDTGDSSNSSGITSAESSASGDTSGESSAEENTDVIAAESVTLDQTELTLEAGSTAQLTASVSPEGWAGTVIWTSSDTNIATVDETGLVTWVAAGSCTITAAADSVTAAANVTCNEAAPVEEPITITAFGNTMDGDFTVKIGEEIPFKATGGDGANYAWSIADAGVATLDPLTGSCTGLAEGKTTMTVTSGSQTATVTVRVVSAG